MKCLCIIEEGGYYPLFFDDDSWEEDMKRHLCNDWNFDDSMAENCIEALNDKHYFREGDLKVYAEHGYSMDERQEGKKTVGFIEKGHYTACLFSLDNWEEELGEFLINDCLEDEEETQENICALTDNGFCPLSDGSVMYIP